MVLGSKRHATGSVGRGVAYRFAMLTHEAFLWRWRTAIMERVTDLAYTQRNIDETGHTFETVQGWSVSRFVLVREQIVYPE